jgi:hypothetical protein
VSGLGLEWECGEVSACALVGPIKVFAIDTGEAACASLSVNGAGPSLESAQTAAEDTLAQALEALLKRPSLIARLPTDALARAARAAVDELRERGRSLGIEAERDQHATALRVIERLAGSALAVGQIAAATPANDGT